MARARKVLLPIVVAAAAFAGPPVSAQRLHDEDIRRMIIEESLARFGSGDCPCPYSYAWNGAQCADKSLYSRRVAIPDLFCYPADIPPHLVFEYRRSRGL